MTLQFSLGGDDDAVGEHRRDKLPDVLASFDDACYTAVEFVARCLVYRWESLMRNLIIACRARRG
jgi:hypothetical protein